MPSFWQCPLTATTLRTAEAHTELTGKMQHFKKLSFNTEGVLGGEKKNFKALWPP